MVDNKKPSSSAIKQPASTIAFAWEAFSLLHPDDWAPVTITGDRKEGYIRLASTGRLSCQVRWKESAKAGNLEDKLESYFGKIRTDARRAKSKLENHVEVEGDALSYQYSGFAHGKGKLFHDPVTSRVFFLEVTSTKADRLGTPFKAIEDSFETGPERWAVLGLDLRLPGQLKVEKKVFLSGRTQLILGGQRVTVDAQRWGFGEQLVAKHGFANWARAALDLRHAAATETDIGVVLELPSLLRGHSYALAKLQPERNQIVTVKVRTRKEHWRPTWEWFV